MLQPDEELVAPVTCLITDVDGVLTDGRIHYDDAGHEWKTFHVRDGYAIKQWMAAGFGFGIITARASGALRRRAAELGVTHLVESSPNKIDSAETMLKAMGGDFGSTAYVGDDIPDWGVMQRCHLGVAPSDAALDIGQTADWIMKSPGGGGVIREVVERILRAKKRWNVLGGPSSDRPSGSR